MTPRTLARHVSRAHAALVATDRKIATVYLRPDLTVRVSRIGRRRTHGRGRGQTVLVTIGKPNYAGRAFVKACQQAREPFPVKKVQFAGIW